MWFWCVSRHCRRSTSSGRLELRPSSSRPTLLVCCSRCSLRGVRASGVLLCHPTYWKLQKSALMECDAVSPEPSPTVQAPSKWKAPRSPDSVSSQYVLSCPSRSKNVLIFAKVLLWCRQIRFYRIQCSLPKFGDFDVVFTQHSFISVFVCCMTLISPFLHHPLILYSQLLSRSFFIER